MDLKQQILESDDMTRELVEVPEWGVKVEVRSLPGRQRSDLLGGAVDDDGNVNLSGMVVDLIVLSTHDPETGAHVFTSEDAEALNAKNGAALERIAKVAMRLSGLSEEALDVAGKGSSDTPSAVSTSRSRRRSG